MQYEQFHPESKVWIYTSNRTLNTQEIEAINSEINAFTNQWTAHQNSVLGYGKVFHQHFIVLIADQTQTEVSGCSIDSSVKFIKAMGAKYGIDFFDRQQLVYIKNGNAELTTISEFQELLDNHTINADVQIFNPLLFNLSDFNSKFETKLSESPLRRMFNIPSEVH